MRRERLATTDLLALVAGLSVVLAGLAIFPAIWTRGEAREAMVVRDILRNGDWILPFRNGVLASKPPLFHWIATLAARAGGLTDVVFRLPSVLGALGLALATMSLGFDLEGRRRAWLAVGMLCGCFVFWDSGSEARVDMLFACAITVSLCGFWRWYRHEAAGGKLACYLGVAAAVMTKGPAGAVLPGLVIVLFLLAERDLRALRSLWSWRLVLLAAAPVALWYGLAIRAGGHAFVAKQLLGENVDRFVGAGEFAHRRQHHPFKLLQGFFAHLFPWSLLAVVALARPDAARSHERKFLHAWWIGVLAFFMVAAGRRNVYLLPLYPAVVLLAAGQVQPWLERHGVAAIAGVIALIDVAVVGGVQYGRVRDARAAELVPLAAVARTLPASTTLRAAPVLKENEVVVTAFLADRRITRGPLTCEPGAAWLVNSSRRDLVPPALGPAATVMASAKSCDGYTLLVTCPALPGS